MTIKDLLEALVATHGETRVYVGGTVIAFVLWTIADAIYQIFFSPLADIPGPLLCKVTRAVNAYKLLSGIQPQWIRLVHLKYGALVRLGPNHVAYAAPETWKDVMTYKPNLGTGKHIPHFGRDPAMYVMPPNGVHNIHSTPDDVEHARVRRLVAHAFSDKALREIEPLVRKHIELLISLLHESITGPAKGKVDLVNWLNYTTFDIIGDLTFGSSFGCLQDSELHPWISMIFDNLRAVCIFSAVGQWPWAVKALKAILPPKIKALQKNHFDEAAKRVDERLAIESDRPDFVTLLTRAGKGGAGLTRDELHSNATLLVLAGSETTATALDGMFYNLLMRPETYARLVEEIRTVMPKDSDITLETLNKLPYMTAVIEEGMRVYTPAPTDIARMSPPEGKMLAGHWIPGGTRTSTCLSAILTDPDSFKNPTTFAPERWLGEKPEEYGTDRLNTSKPFNAGPRNCVGRNLAYVEMRLILAKLLWNFDFELCEESRDWMNQKIFILWEKGPLMVKLSKVIR